MKVEVALLGSPSLIVLNMVCVDVKQHSNSISYAKSTFAVISGGNRSLQSVWAGERKNLGSIPLRLSFLFKKVVVFVDTVL